MQSEQYIDNMQKIQNKILTFLDDDADNEENFENLQILFRDQKITKNKNEFKSLLYLISNIGNYHYRKQNFFNKLEKILKLLEDDITKKFTDSEIFNIFDNNMRLLLFLFDEKILIFNHHMYDRLSDKEEFLIYFSPEITENIPSDSIKSFSIKYFCNDEFYKLRAIGENENEICKLIRNDNVTKFITYINRNNISPNEIIENSNYETNPFLVGKNVSLIEYAAFYGSIQIFKFLKRHVSILNESIWNYAIHGNNFEIIHELEEDRYIPKQSFLSCFMEAIKCHHNDLANYFHQFLLAKKDEYLKNSLFTALDYYNFTFMNDNIIDESFFNHLVKNDYVTLVSFLLKTKNIDVNENTQLLYYAVEKARIEIISLLVNIDKIDINAYNTVTCHNEIKRIAEIQKKTALYLAIEEENIKIVKLLLTNKNLDINILNEKYIDKVLIESKTALYLAVEKENIKIIKLLLTNKNINVNLLNRMNVYLETALYLAVDKGNIKIIKLLLSNNKIDINVALKEIYKTNDQSSQIKVAKNIVNTPLHLAVEKMNVEIVKLLLKQKNVDIQIKNDDGKTAFDYAKNENIKQLFPH